MSQSQIEDVVSTLLSAPVKAATYANREQMLIWRDYLKEIKAVISAADSDQQKVNLINQYISMAPKWKVAAQIEVGITMRVASISKTSAGGSLGIAVGLVQTAGQFSSETSTSTESLLTARALYSLTNDNEVQLANFLNSLGIDPAAPEQITTAVETLEKITVSSATTTQ